MATMRATHAVSVNNRGQLRCICYRGPRDIWCTGIQEYVNQTGRGDFRRLLEPGSMISVLVPFARGFGALSMKFEVYPSNLPTVEGFVYNIVKVSHEEFTILLGAEDGLITAIRGAEDYYRTKPEFDAISSALRNPILTPGVFREYCAAPKHDHASHLYLRKCLNLAVQSNLEEQFLLACTACFIMQKKCPRCFNLADTSEDVPEIPF